MERVMPSEPPRVLGRLVEDRGFSPDLVPDDDGGHADRHYLERNAYPGGAAGVPTKGCLEAIDRALTSGGHRRHHASLRPRVNACVRASLALDQQSTAARGNG